jgi:hypothetical protein
VHGAALLLLIGVYQTSFYRASQLSKQEPPARHEGTQTTKKASAFALTLFCFQPKQLA